MLSKKSLLVCIILAVMSSVMANDKIPKVLQPWQAWVNWDNHQAPSLYFKESQKLYIWRNKLQLNINRGKGDFLQTITCFKDMWVDLPGDDTSWPQDVKVDNDFAVVLSKNKKPSVKLIEGTHTISGNFVWTNQPKFILVPKSTGLIDLKINGRYIDYFKWTNNGRLYLSRQSVVKTKDFVNIDIYRLLEDNIPLILKTKVVLSVAGRNREQLLGNILPKGWKLSSVSSPLPVMINQSGQLRVQLRSGTYTLDLTAFSSKDIKEIKYADGAKPLVAREFIGVKSFNRVLDLTGAKAIDSSITQFPRRWRKYPVYLWQNQKKINLRERQLSLKTNQANTLHLSREAWLSDNGDNFIIVDKITGRLDKPQRLNVNNHLVLGEVKIDNKRELITLDSNKNLSGVEVNKVNLNLKSVGTLKLQNTIDAVNWQQNIKSLKWQINLPPGWRMFAVFGAESVKGDFLTSWSLLDLFLVLVFALAVYRVWGLWAGVIALFGFALSYHDYEAPCYIWFVLLVPIVLLKHVKLPKLRLILNLYKWGATIVTICIVLPFMQSQIQSVIYPQLETVDRGYDITKPLVTNMRAESLMAFGGMAKSVRPMVIAEDTYRSNQNLKYDSNMKVQTGPGIPYWHWRKVLLQWNHPVKSNYTFKAILISPLVFKFITVVKLVFILAILAIFFNIRLGKKTVATLSCIFMLFCNGGIAKADIPNENMLSKLQMRLNQSSGAFPNAANIVNASIKINDNNVEYTASIHAGDLVALPLPGSLIGWEPKSVVVDGSVDCKLLRKDGFLWLALEKGIHKIKVTGILTSLNEWHWVFKLKPKHLTIDAPEWDYIGLDNNVIEQQIFFSRKAKLNSSIDKQFLGKSKLYSAFVLERKFDFGLKWRVHNTLRRISTTGPASSFNIDCIPNAKIIFGNVHQKNNKIKVNILQNQNYFSWTSEIPFCNSIVLKASSVDGIAEVWKSTASPLWHIDCVGLKPVFKTDNNKQVPVWHPWPKQKLTFNISKPKAIKGKTLTIQSVRQKVAFGDQQYSTTLDMEIVSSLGGDFLIDLPKYVQVKSLQRNGQDLLIHQQGDKLLIVLQPGSQDIQVKWDSPHPIQAVMSNDNISLMDKASNVSTEFSIPKNRWVLFAKGPMMGPAVKFWGVLLCVFILSLILGNNKFSPLSRIEWFLLGVGISQVHILLGLVVVIWLFSLAYRTHNYVDTLNNKVFDFMQIGIVLLSAISIFIFVAVVYAGLLGKPEMFIEGNYSSAYQLKWYASQTGAKLYNPTVISVSIWYYRILMLLWSLWLAHSLINWLRWGWQQLTANKSWKSFFA